MTTPLDDPRLSLARIAVGAVSVATDLALPSRVLHLVDSQGNAYFAKRHTQPSRFAQEIRAYGQWTRHLDAATPALVAHHEETLTLLLTAVPGQRGDSLVPGSDTEHQAHRDAGAALRALHSATLAPADRSYGRQIAGRLRLWTDQADQAGLITPAAVTFLRSAADDLGAAALQGAVCHLDYQPRNWCIGPAFAVLDFEHMRPDARLRDLARLRHRFWSSAPHLEAAFVEGYGALTREDEEVLHCLRAYEAATALVRGHERHDRELHGHGRALLDHLM